MNENSYYWLADVLLDEGSIVLPGNWIRIVNNTPGHYLALREHVYEALRLSKFPNLPSRYTSSFICIGLDDIQNFRAKNDKQRSVLYEVSVVDNTALMTSLDSELLGIQNMHEGGRMLSVEELSEQASAYWSSNSRTDIAIPEILVESPIKILRRVD